MDYVVLYIIVLIKWNYKWCVISSMTRLLIPRAEDHSDSKFYGTIRVWANIFLSKSHHCSQLLSLEV